MSEEESMIIHAKNEREVQAHLSKRAVDIVSPHIQQEVSVEAPHQCLEASDEVKRLQSNVEEVDVNIAQQEKEMKEHEKRIREDMSKFDAFKQMKEAIEKMCRRLKEVNDQRKAVEHLCSNNLELMITVRNHAEAVANAKLLARLLPKGALWCRTEVTRGLYYEASSMASADGLFDDAALERIICSGESADDLAPLKSFLNASEVENCEPLDENEKAMAQNGAKVDHEGRITHEGRYDILN